jgi:APA family basic amino acid/polyamine antiporter
MVCIAVWILELSNLFRTNFKVPVLPVIAVCGIAINIYLMTQLSLDAQKFRWLVSNRSI